MKLCTNNATRSFREDPASSGSSYQHIRQGRNQRLRSVRTGGDDRAIDDYNPALRIHETFCRGKNNSDG